MNGQTRSSRSTGVEELLEVPGSLLEEEVG
jgi:hypothetical protein